MANQLLVELKSATLFSQAIFLSCSFLRVIILPLFLLESASFLLYYRGKENTATQSERFFSHNFKRAKEETWRKSGQFIIIEKLLIAMKFNGSNYQLANHKYFVIYTIP